MNRHNAQPGARNETVSLDIQHLYCFEQILLPQSDWRQQGLSDEIAIDSRSLVCSAIGGPDINSQATWKHTECKPPDDPEDSRRRLEDPERVEYPMPRVRKRCQ